MRQNLFVMEVGWSRPVSPPAVFPFVFRVSVRSHGRPVIFHVYIRRHVQWTAESVKIIESQSRGAMSDGLAEINFVDAGFDVVPVPSQMPFSDCRSLVSLFLQQGCKGFSAGRDQRLGITVKHTAFQGWAPVVASCQNAVTCRGADRWWGVCIQKDNTFARHAVHIFCFYPWWRIEIRYITISHIIGQDENDVGSIRIRKNRSGKTGQQQWREQMFLHFFKVWWLIS